jgi:hypothetical protein
MLAAMDQHVLSRKCQVGIASETVCDNPQAGCWAISLAATES